MNKQHHNNYLSNPAGNPHPLLASITNLHGVGESLFPKLAKTYGSRIIDLLLIMPAKLISRICQPCFDINLLDEVQSFNFTVSKIDSFNKRQKFRQNFKITGNDDKGQKIILQYFNLRNQFLIDKIILNKTYYVSGKVSKQENNFSISHPDYLLAHDMVNFKQSLPLRYERVYPLTTGVNNKFFCKLLKQALKIAINSPLADEWLAKEIIAKNNLPSFVKALQTMHIADDKQILEPHSPARRRLAFDVYLSFFCGLYFLQNRKSILNKNPLSHDTKKNDTIKKFIASLPFTLTKDQKTSIDDIFADFQSKNYMKRILLGDVGCGKTIIAFITALPFLLSPNNYQVIILAPTELLTNQHYNSLAQFTKQLNISIAILTGKDKGKKREKKITDIKDGNVQLIIGTHALLQDDVKFQNLKYIIIDEQHKFGVNQRQKLLQKSNVHLLSMSATPIPRSLQLVQFGEIDTSIIKTKPKERKEVLTKIITKDRLKQLIESLYEIIEKGEQIYWVCPLVNENDTIKTQAVIERYNYLKSIFSSKVGMIHGQMKSQEKLNAWDLFTKQTTSILVASTIIEVGIDSKEATIIIIEDAINLGLSQLHQLRGRVGRGTKQSFCLCLYQPPISIKAQERLITFKENPDGFKLAEADLKIRGPGQILGQMQSGHINLPIVDENEHMDIQNQALDYCKSLIIKAEKSHYLKNHIMNKLLGIFNQKDIIKNFD